MKYNNWIATGHDFVVFEVKGCEGAVLTLSEVAGVTNSYSYTLVFGETGNSQTTVEVYSSTHLFQ